MNFTFQRSLYLMFEINVIKIIKKKISNFLKKNLRKVNICIKLFITNFQINYYRAVSRYSFVILFIFYPYLFIFLLIIVLRRKIVILFKICRALRITRDLCSLLDLTSLVLFPGAPSFRPSLYYVRFSRNRVI